MVTSDWVPKSKMLPGETVTMQCAHGDTVFYKLAEVDISVYELRLSIKAAVLERLPVPVLLETDISQLCELLCINATSVHTSGLNHAFVTTRAKARRDAEEEEKRVE